MDSKIKKIKFKLLSLSYSLKVALAFSFFTVIFAAFVLLVLFYYIENHTIDLLRERIKDYGKTAFYFSNRNDFENLKELKETLELKWQETIKNNPEILKEIPKIPPGETLEILTEEEHQKLYYNQKTQSLVQILRKIRASSMPSITLKDYYEIKFYDSKNPPLLKFTYILIPIRDFNNLNYAMFLLDS